MVDSEILRHIPGIALQSLRELHGDVRRIVAVLSLLGALQRDGDALLARRNHRHGLLDQLIERPLEV